MPWPSLPDFTDAVQNPAVCFDDPELAGGKVEEKPNGMPQVHSGNFASVYPVTAGGGRKFAVRCFTREITDQRERYGRLDEYLRQTLPPTLVDFEFHERGIRVRGEWYPIVKMDWVDGAPLNKYARENLGQQSEIIRVARRWRGAVGDLLSREIAHNDLQHGNVMVQGDSSIRLVDYDGIFLPQYQGQSSPEIGHQNFQHPQRTGQHYATYVDNFPALVIYLSLLALADDPGLWRFNNDDNLILTKADYADPANSECFRDLKNSQDDNVRSLAAYLEELCFLPVGEVPDLESVLDKILVPAPIPSPYQGSESQQRITDLGIAPAPDPFVPQPPTPGGILCPQCNRRNLDDLIYCDDEECAAVLHRGSQLCAYCRLSNPVNAIYCPDCGQKVA